MQDSTIQQKREKIISLRHKRHDPDAQERSKILEKHIKGKGVDLDEFGFYEFVIAESTLDRQKDVLTKGFLESLAVLYKEGRTVVDSHSQVNRLGLVYDAYVQPHSEHEGEHELVAKMYVPPFTKTIGGNSAKQEIDAGIVSRASISYFAPAEFVPANAEKNILGTDYYRFDAQDTSDRNTFDVFELSLVTMGAQSGARIKDMQDGSAGANFGGGGANRDGSGGTNVLNQNEGNASAPRLQENQQQKSVNMEAYKIKALDIEVQAEPQVVEAIKSLEQKHEEAKAKLLVYQEAEEKQLEKLRAKAINLLAISYKLAEIDFDADEANKELLLLNQKQLESKIAYLEKTTKVKQIIPNQQQSPAKASDDVIL